MVKTLSELGLTALGGSDGGADVLVTGLTVDSRDVQEGYLFAALPGSNVHGGTFIKYALGLGAKAILTDPEGARIAAPEIAQHSPAMIIVEDPRQALAYAAALWFGRQPEAMVAVTGTNGKTSVTCFTRQIWQIMGHRAINIGTTGVEGDWQTPSPNTTPEPITLQRMLFDAAASGVSHGAMEASSHGLAQRRLDGVALRAAGFTNFTQDHLDYHATFDAYFAAKAGLFTRVLGEDGVAVINVDDARGMELEGLCAERGVDVMRVGRSDTADLRIVGQRFDATGQDLRVDFVGNIYQIRLDLIGGFQAENVMMAAGLVMACGGDPDEVFSCLPELAGVRGRMQLAATRANGAAVFVDYAHTPDAVSTAISALRPHVMGRVIAVVGAGGDRDKGKRPLMGAAAEKSADVVVITDDNPRSEDPAVIRAEVKEGAPNAIEIADRSEAILRAVDMLQPGDALLICGKGHESGQIVGDIVYPFDDVEQASMSVAVLEGTL